MAILKRRKISASNKGVDQLDGLSSPVKLLALAKSNNLEINPLDIESLIRLLGIGLRIHPMDEQKSGYIKLEEGRWVIGVNSLQHPNRQRFTMGHEIGHFILHKDQIGDGIEDTLLFRASGFGEPGIEKEANEFAAKLLMPEDYFKQEVEKFHGDIKAISRNMKLSSMAVSIRAQYLGYKVKNEI